MNYKQTRAYFNIVWKNGVPTFNAKFSKVDRISCDLLLDRYSCPIIVYILMRNLFI